MTETSQAQPRAYKRNAEIFPDTEWPEGMHRVALAVEYQGTHYHGFQTQPSGVPTVQGHLERALSAVANEPISLICAGRTDAGVHATGQIVHFDTMAERPEKAWVLGTRAQLPFDIAVRWARPVEPGFHARFSARSRTYRYLISDRDTYSALTHQHITWSRKRLNVGAMREAAQALVGEHDFTSFRASQCQARSPVRRIDYLHLVRRGDLIVLEVRANAFLHHMVRNIVGVLLAIGAGEADIGWAADILVARDRSAGGVTARPFGLYLVHVDYPAAFGLPSGQPGPIFVPEPLGGLMENP
ncbi:tRNA pseudouridine(38-40) synthase TruA [Marinimicrobium koreense]|uniref:tRNA pseudouridine synthase A n=1 Tax=Marinimicrobium koreense TaxID=306545 RepID=A0A3N1P0Y4_9GAMM|nr:tRNA pseudouridine38-40 synthase [Marinimicrobium koreense]